MKNYVMVARAISETEFPSFGLMTSLGVISNLGKSENTFQVESSADFKQAMDVVCRSLKLPKAGY